MSDSSPQQHITDQLAIYKKQLTSFSKTYYKYSQELPNFMYKNKMIQFDILNDLYEQSSQLQGLLREIIDDEVNGETLRQLASFSSNNSSSSSSDPNNRQKGCTCPHCNNNKQDNEEEEEGYYYDDPADEEED